MVASLKYNSHDTSICLPKQAAFMNDSLLSAMNLHSLKFLRATNFKIVRIILAIVAIV